MLVFEQSWGTQTNTYPTTPQGDAFAVIGAIAKKYFSAEVFDYYY